MSDRQKFLDAVRHAVREGNRAGSVPPLPTRGNVGYQGAGPDPVARLRTELTAAGGVLHVVADEAAAVAAVVRLVNGARRVLLGDGAFIERLKLADALDAAGVAVQRADAGKEAFFAADVGVTGVEAVIAETGTIVLETRPGQPRAASLLPPVHVAIAHVSQVTADLFDLFGTSEVPACLTLITGPSKTGDIELQLVTGVHGPGEVHLVLVTAEASGAA